MAIWYVDSAAAGTDAGTSWTNAWTSLGSAFTNVTTAGDVIYISHTHNEQLAADTTYTFSSNHTIDNPLKIYSVNKTNDAITAGAFVGHDSLNRSIAISCSSGIAGLYIEGMTFQVAGSTGDFLNIGLSGRVQLMFKNCGFYLLNTSAVASIGFGYTSTARGMSAVFIGCEFRFGSTSQGLYCRGSGCKLVFIDCQMSNGATHPTILFNSPATSFNATLIGCDCSTITTIINAHEVHSSSIVLRQCRLASGFVLCNASIVGLDLTDVIALDCGVGDQQGYIAYGDSLGSVQIDTGIFCNDNISDSDLSWKLVSTINASKIAPFVSPWISVYHDGTSAITPYIEILRSGSATAFNDDEVWAEWMFKATSGSTKGTVGDDHAASLATPTAQANSSKTATDWTGEDATSWFGKLGPGSSITPAEAGDLSFRICVGIPSTTVYVDPQIRGLA